MENNKPADVPVLRPEGSDVERLIATGERLLKSQQERLITEETNYQHARLALLDGYRVKMERARQEAEDALRTLAADHDAKMLTISQLVSKLKAMREA